MAGTSVSWTYAEQLSHIYSGLLVFFWYLTVLCTLPPFFTCTNSKNLPNLLVQITIKFKSNVPSKLFFMHSSYTYNCNCNYVLISNYNWIQSFAFTYRVRLFFKLFLLMGVSWILELISFLIFEDNANIPVIIGDMLNILQPIAIFIIFVCKKDILKSLGEKYSFVTSEFCNKRHYFFQVPLAVLHVLNSVFHYN